MVKLTFVFVNIVKTRGCPLVQKRYVIDDEMSGFDNNEFPMREELL